MIKRTTAVPNIKIFPSISISLTLLLECLLVLIQILEEWTSELHSGNNHSTFFHFHVTGFIDTQLIRDKKYQYLVSFS